MSQKSGSMIAAFALVPFKRTLAWSAVQTVFISFILCVGLQLLSTAVYEHQKWDVDLTRFREPVGPVSPIHIPHSWNQVRENQGNLSERATIALRRLLSGYPDQGARTILEEEISRNGPLLALRLTEVPFTKRYYFGLNTEGRLLINAHKLFQSHSFDESRMVLLELVGQLYYKYNMADRSLSEMSCFQVWELYHQTLELRCRDYHDWASDLPVPDSIRRTCQSEHDHKLFDQQVLGLAYSTEVAGEFSPQSCHHEWAVLAGHPRPWTFWFADWLPLPILEE